MVYGPYVFWGVHVHHKRVAIPVVVGAKYILHPTLWDDGVASQSQLCVPGRYGIRPLRGVGGVHVHHYRVAIPVGVDAKSILYPYELINTVAIPVVCPGGGMVYGSYVGWCWLHVHRQHVAIPVAVDAKYILHQCLWDDGVGSQSLL